MLDKTNHATSVHVFRNDKIGMFLFDKVVDKMRRQEQTIHFYVNEKSMLKKNQ